MDPRNPKRPPGKEGDNWARCRECGREGPTIKAIRHVKNCSARKKKDR